MAVVSRRFNTSSVLGSTTISSTSAPALTGIAGSLISVLDYCLTDATYGIGWTKQYSGTNTAVYKQPAGTNGFYLAVDDSVGQNATVCGFETMSSVSAGIGRFPTLSQRSALQSGWNSAFYKSGSLDAVNRAWQFFSNGKIFYLVGYNNASSNTSVSTCNILVFGDFTSYAPVDAFNTILLANSSLSATSTSLSLFYARDAWTSTTDGVAARSYTQLGSAVYMTPVGQSGLQNGTGNYFGGSGEAFPSPITGGLNMIPVQVAENNVGIRGVLPGMWNPLHVRPFNPGDTFSGTGVLAGKTFETSTVGGTSYGLLLFETSDTW